MSRKSETLVSGFHLMSSCHLICFDLVRFALSVLISSVPIVSASLELVLSALVEIDPMLSNLKLSILF